MNDFLFTIFFPLEIFLCTVLGFHYLPNITKLIVAKYNLYFYVTREDSPNRVLFIENLLEDRTESTMAYHEFLTFIQKQLEK